jgi:hypothetical protein
MPDPEQTEESHTTPHQQGTHQNKRPAPNWAEIILVGLTMVYCIVSGLQWQAIGKANKIANDTLKQVQATQRPWLTADKAKFKDLNSAGFATTFSVINSGTAPALDLVAEVTAYATMEDKKIVAQTIPRIIAVPRALIGPNQTRDFEVVFSFGSAVITPRIYPRVVVNLTYTDQFSNSHFTPICFYFWSARPESSFSCIEDASTVKIKPTTVP